MLGKRICFDIDFSTYNALYGSLQFQLLDEVICVAFNGLVHDRPIYDNMLELWGY